jgi:hypothetical protein
LQAQVDFPGNQRKTLWLVKWFTDRKIAGLDPVPGVGRAFVIPGTAEGSGEQTGIENNQSFNDGLVIFNPDFKLIDIFGPDFLAPPDLGQISVIEFCRDIIGCKIFHHDVNIRSGLNGTIGNKTHSAFAVVAHPGLIK